MTSEATILDELEASGCAWVREVVDRDRCRLLGEQLDFALSTADSSLRHGDQIYGARNLLDIFPAAGELLKLRPVRDLCGRVLGSEWGIVRGLFFDKPPGSSWSLPWHQDLTIAVKNNQIKAAGFSHPTRKAGVDHIEAPTWLLGRMLTMRFHLDAMTTDNGPLLVHLRSHHAGKSSQARMPQPGEMMELHCEAGDCLLMRPLLSHSSRLSNRVCPERRRVIHLELSACPTLPNGLQWHRYLSCTHHD